MIHESHEYSKIFNVFKSGEGSDFSIFVLDDEGQKLEKKVHQLVIRQCPYFAAMLDLKGTEAKNGSVTIDNMTTEALEYILNYLYTEETPEMTMELAIEIASAADYFQLASLGQLATKTWKNLFTKLDRKQTVDAFRLFFEGSLLVPDASWREVMEMLLDGMFGFIEEGVAPFAIEKESRNFIECLVEYFGQTHPYFSGRQLHLWTTAEGLELSHEAKNERKRVAANLVKKINWMGLTLRTIALSLESEAFPRDFMVDTICKKAKVSDKSVSGCVVYTISFKRPRIIELEHETGPVLFRFYGLTEETPTGQTIWEFLTIPKNCTTAVSLKHRVYNSSDHHWADDEWSGAKEGLLIINNGYISDEQAVVFVVYLSKKIDEQSNNNDSKNTNEEEMGYYGYNLDYD